MDIIIINIYKNGYCIIVMLFVTFDSYTLRSAFLGLQNIPNVCNWFQL